MPTDAALLLSAEAGVGLLLLLSLAVALVGGVSGLDAFTVDVAVVVAVVVVVTGCLTDDPLPKRDEKIGRAHV